MGSIGFPETITILLIALLVFGPTKLPEFGRALGKMMCEIRKATRDINLALNDIDEPPNNKE